MVPGVALCVSITAAARTFERLQAGLLGRTYVEALALAILVGAALRTVRTPSARWRPGLAIGAKFLLEAAVALLGASVDLQTAAAAGRLLLAAVVCVVAVALPAGYVAGLVAGLPPRQAVLVACGNAICGNSAIVAVAPVVGHLRRLAADCAGLVRRSARRI